LFSVRGWAGNVIHGGDSVYCDATGGANSKFQVDGFYVLDYVVNFPESLDELEPVGSLKDSLDRIEALLRKNAPDSLSSFQDFRRSLTLSNPTPDDIRRWYPSQNPLRYIHDQFVNHLPSNCRYASQQSGDNLLSGVFLQTVIRSVSPPYIIYQYDPAIVDDYLARPNALQASVLFIHEWLWDYYDKSSYGAPRIRHANAFLHSKRAERSAGNDFIQNVFQAKP
jgi:hypothetical protein